MSVESVPNVAPVFTAPAAQTQVTNSSLIKQTEPDAALGTNPLLDRTVLEEPTVSHLEETPKEQPEVVPEEEAKEPTAPPATLAEMVGAELMQDPGCSLVAKGLERMLAGKVDHNRAFGKAIEQDDARFIDTEYLKDILGDNAAEAIQAAEFLMDYADTYTVKLQEKLYSSVEGGEEAVKLAARHFNETAAPADKALVAQLLDSGNMEYMQHAIRIMTERTSNLAPKHHAQTFANPSALQPLSREEFGKMVLDNPGMSEGDYNKLRERLATSFRQNQ